MEIYTLRCVGMDVKGYDNTESFWEDLHKESPELILMDGALYLIESVKYIGYRMKKAL
jgi:hypothetical protein